jgi:hypothetical protein
MLRSAGPTQKANLHLGTCIYCAEEKELSPEHYLPECLGKFENYETLNDRICYDCNHKCGRLVDEQFCRGGEIGYFRTLLGITGKKSHKTKVDLFQRGAAGASELRMKGTVPGANEEIRLQLTKSVQPDGTPGVDYMPQLIVTAESGDIHHILLGVMVETEQLQKKMEELNIGLPKQLNVIAQEADLERVEQLTSFLPVLEKTKWEPLPDQGVIYTTTEFEVDDRYFRAIAKIAFHYVLKHFRNFRGDEQIFAGIRSFIINGGNISDFVTWNDKQIIQIKEGYTPDGWAHLVLARANEHVIFSRLQFFLGPNCIPYIYTVALGHNQTQLIYNITAGHSFAYYKAGQKEGKVGVMDELLYIYKSI